MVITGIEGTEGIVLLVGRILFGGIIAFTGLNHFMQTEEMTEYARHKDLPAAQLGVLLSGAVLLLGGLSIVVGVFPVLGAFTVAGFLFIAALTFHDFWAVPEDQTQTEMTHFLKNIALAGGALAIAAIGWETWAYALNVRFF